ncbi:MAG TPA: hypothetical protein VMS64_16040 [Candidatus Methylomirabilis sp.]|nr:hypothetical protein [Candidatus Methylomirabilis sp.]
MIEPERQPAALAARLDHILAVGARMIALVPGRQRGDGAHDDDHVALDVAYQMFRQSLAFADAMDLGRFPADWRQPTIPRDLQDGGALARYGALVRARLSGWFEGAAPAEYARTIETDRGPERGHALLERTTRDAAQQMLRLRELLADLGVRPDESSPVR